MSKQRTKSGSSYPKPEAKIIDCKVTLLGDSGVGKSSLIGRYISGVFMNGIMSTTGANYSQKIIEKDDNKLRLNIWDTAGQEKYRALGRNFYKDAIIIALVYDVTSRESFESIKENWYPDVQKYGEKFNIVAIVGNKCDKYEEEHVTEDEANNYAKEIGAQFFLVSACTGDGVDEMFDEMANIYFSPEFESKRKEIEKNRAKTITIKKNDLSKQQTKSKGCCGDSE